MKPFSQQQRSLLTPTWWDRLWCLALCGIFAAVGEYAVHIILARWPSPWWPLIPLLMFLEYAAIGTLSAPGFSRAGMIAIYDLFVVSAIAVAFFTLSGDDLGWRLGVIMTAGLSVSLATVSFLGALVSNLAPKRRRY